MKVEFCFRGLHYVFLVSSAHKFVNTTKNNTSNLQFGHGISIVPLDVQNMFKMENGQIRKMETLKINDYD